MPSKKKTSPRPKKQDKRKKVGRPVELNVKVSAGICRMIKAGNWMETSAVANGITATTFRDWMKRGNEAIANKSTDHRERMFARFVHAVHRATAEAETADLENVNGPANAGDWRASAWKMERRYRDSEERLGWNLPNKTELKGNLDHAHKGHDGGPVKVEATVDWKKAPPDLQLRMLEFMEEQERLTAEGTAAAVATVPAITEQLTEERGTDAAEATGE